MNYQWIILIIALIFGCYFFYKAGKFREDKESIYKKSMKCPWDNDFCAVDGRSRQGDYVTKVCKRCPRQKISN